MLFVQCTLTFCLIVLNVEIASNFNQNFILSRSEITSSNTNSNNNNNINHHFTIMSRKESIILEQLNQSNVASLLQQDETKNEFLIICGDCQTASRNYHQQEQQELMDFWPAQVFWITSYTVTALVSLILNSVTLYVLLHNSISTGLGKFLINLSVSDIAVSIFCIPTTYTQVMFQKWIFPNFFCPVVNFAQIITVFVSVWTLTMIGIDR